MQNSSEFDFLTIESLIPLIYTAFRGKNEFSMTKIHDKKLKTAHCGPQWQWWPRIVITFPRAVTARHPPFPGLGV